MKRSLRRPVASLVVLLMVAACAPPGGPAITTGGTSQASLASAAASGELRLGYFPNVTHATAILGLRQGTFARHLGSGVTLTPHPFNAGPEAVEAIFSGGLDATFIGPNPAINAFSRSKGEAIRIVSGATSGGAFLVVRADIGSPAELRGKKLATPQLGNTQDVALRSWLAGQGLQTDVRGGGDVAILPQANAQTLDTFKAGQIDGAWVPEPWATRLIREGDAQVLVDERDLWPDGKYVTTHLIVRTEYLTQHPDIVKALLAGLVEANSFANEQPAEAQRMVNEGIAEIAGKPLADDVLAAAWKNLTFTYDPVASSLAKSAADATELGLLDQADLQGIYDLTLLNQVLAEAGKTEIPKP